MFAALARFSTHHWKLVLTLTAIFAAGAFHAFRELPVEAYPDVTDPMVEVVAVFPGQSAEETERQVSLELERVLAGTPHLANIRTVSVFGLSVTTLRFDEASSDKENRIHVAERLREAELPDGVEALIGPQATPVGQIYRYTLAGPRPLRELRALQDWVIERRLRSVPGVADVVTFGGFERQYAVRVDPVRLASAGVTVGQVYSAIEESNRNAGGGYVGIGGQEFIVRGVGVLRDALQIGDALVVSRDGLPIRVRDVADVFESSVPRRGSVGRGAVDDVVEGIVLLRRGENPERVLEALQVRIDEVSEILPEGVKIEPFYDRRELTRFTLGTVGRNLLHGAILVTSVVLLFLRSWSAALIIACVIPLSLATAFLGLYVLGMSANLISMGAIDFGILVENAAVILEVTLHGLAVSQARAPDAASTMPADRRREAVAEAALLVARPIGLASLIIIVALVPLFLLERVEGRIFRPMAFTYIFALLGGLFAALTVVPAMAGLLLPKRAPRGEARWFLFVQRAYVAALAWARPRRYAVLGGALLLTLGVAAHARGIGTEFLPELNEGGLYITAVFPPSIALDETKRSVPEIRRRLLALPEAVDVLSHIGRPEDATQTEGPNNAEFFVKLAPMDRWRSGKRLPDLEAELRESLREIPGVSYNFSQPITDRVFETISGIIGQVVIKVKGEDLATLTSIAEDVKARLEHVEGVADLSLYQAGDIPQISIDLDRDLLARHGLSVAEAQEVIEVALGGKVATEVWEGERRYGVALRLPDEVRRDPESIGRLVVGGAEERVTLSEVATITPALGRASIWRENLSRFVAVKFNVRGSDLGTVVKAAQEEVADIELPEGVALVFGGEFENQQRAMSRLSVIVPLVLLVMIGILYWNFGRWPPAIAIMGTLPVSVAFAVGGLRLMGEHFSISAAVGCITLLGQITLAGVLLCTRIDHAALAREGDASLEGARVALRPVMLTVSLAAIGLVPAALSHGMGSESQRPFAIAIIAGLVATVPLVLLLLPLFYRPAVSRAGGGDPQSENQDENRNESRNKNQGENQNVTASPTRAGAAAGAAMVSALALLLGAPHAASAQDTPPLPSGAAHEVSEASEITEGVSVDDLLERWLEGSREVAAWRAELGASRFDVVTARLLPNPELGVEGLRTLRGVPPDGMTNFGANLGMPLPIFGQRGARVEASRRALSAAEASVATRLWERAADIREAAAQRASADAHVEIEERGLEELSEMQRIIESRSAAGVAPRYDAMRAALLRETLEARASAARVEREASEAALLALIGDPELERADVRRGGLPRVAPIEDREELIRAALEQRPDLELARRSRRAALALAKQYKKEAIPTPTLALGTYVTREVNSVSVLGELSVPLPVFDRNQGHIGRAKAEAAGHEAMLAALEARARAEIMGGLRALEEARAARARFEESGVLVTADLLDRARRAYEAGSFSIAELLDAYGAVWEARRELLERDRAVVDAELRLMRAAALGAR